MPKPTSPIFQPEVVQVNQQGQLTAEQVRLLRRSVFVYQSSLVQLYTLFLLLTVCLIINMQDWAMWFCLGAMIIFGMVVLLEWVWKSYRDARQGQVIQVTGRVLGTYHGGRYSSYYHISITRPDGIDSTIYAQKREARLFKQSKSYTFFYVPRTRILLSAVEVA
ncbi:MAG: hypothetical protein F9K46_13390 [Anaerolineae bacterium]|nr:MAG: hypothetical protein F9K46_13390 [Anaerolineae bacterium]